MASAMMRAAVSVDPPGGNGTMSVIGRVGKACAPRTPGTSTASTARNAAVNRLSMGPLLEKPEVYGISRARR